VPSVSPITTAVRLPPLLSASFSPSDEILDPPIAMRLTQLGPVAFLGLAACVHATSSEPEEKPLRPCTIRSAVSGSFFDLNPIWKTLPEDVDTLEEPPESWHVRGYDYGHNFTLNICGPVVEDVPEFEDIDSDHTKNVSAFYSIGDQYYSLG
jgi:hypothetical protein